MVRTRSSSSDILIPSLPPRRRTSLWSLSPQSREDSINPYGQGETNSNVAAFDRGLQNSQRQLYSKDISINSKDEKILSPKRVCTVPLPRPPKQNANINGQHDSSTKKRKVRSWKPSNEYTSENHTLEIWTPASHQHESDSFAHNEVAKKSPALLVQESNLSQTKEAAKVLAHPPMRRSSNSLESNVTGDISSQHHHVLPLQDFTNTFHGQKNLSPVKQGCDYYSSQSHHYFKRGTPQGKDTSDPLPTLSLNRLVNDALSTQSSSPTRDFTQGDCTPRFESKTNKPARLLCFDDSSDDDEVVRGAVDASKNQTFQEANTQEKRSYSSTQHDKNTIISKNQQRTSIVLPRHALPRKERANTFGSSTHAPMTGRNDESNAIHFADSRLLDKLTFSVKGKGSLEFPHDTFDKIKTSVRLFCNVPLEKRFMSVEPKIVEDLCGYSLLNPMEKMHRDLSVVSNDHYHCSTNVVRTAEMKTRLIQKMTPMIELLDAKKRNDLETVEARTGCRVEKGVKGRLNYIDNESGRDISPSEYETLYRSMLKDIRYTRGFGRYDLEKATKTEAISEGVRRRTTPCDHPEIVESAVIDLQRKVSFVIAHEYDPEISAAQARLHLAINTALDVYSREIAWIHKNKERALE